MPDNHRKLLDPNFISRLELMYEFTYIPERNIIQTTFPNSKKIVERPADKKFLILVKKFGKKIIFNLDVIDFWKDFQRSSELRKYSLFAINNAVTFLKITYQEPTKEKIINYLKNEIKTFKEN